MTATASASAARKRILCLDDDEDTRDLMRVLLCDYGYEAVIACSVSDALASAKAGGLALCILDHWMTESNGIELCRQIRAFDSETPIMFYSGAAYTGDIQRGLDAGAQAYLCKPDFDHLKPTIDRLIDENRPAAVRASAEFEGAYPICTAFMPLTLVEPSPPHSDLELTVIGAGLVGLAAAAPLLERGAMTPLILEAGAQVGANLGRQVTVAS